MMARVFVPGRVAPDAFSDILDPALRNERIRQDIENQKRIYEYQQMAKEFEDWDNYNLQSRYGNKVPSKDFYDKNLAAMQYGSKGSFVGAAPSIGAGLETLGITPEGKFTFGRHGNNAVMPLRGISPRSKRMFKTDANGTPIPLSDDEIVLAEKAKDETERQAAMDAATPVAETPNEAPNVASEKPNEAASEVPWYDFLKHPQNTPYEQEQMRNQAIMRDAAIAAAMNKPIIYPEADTLSEPMAKLAGQQNSLAQSAIGQLTSRQGMAADFYKMGSNLVNNYAMNAYNAQIRAQQAYNDAVKANEDAKVVRNRIKALYGENGTEEIKRKNFIRNKDFESAQKIAAQRDLDIQQAIMLENLSQKKIEDANSLIGKANAFKGSANKVSKDIELGYDFGGDIPLYEGFGYSSPSFAGQSEALGGNIGGPINGPIGENYPKVPNGGKNGGNKKNEEPVVEAPVNDVPNELSPEEIQKYGIAGGFTPVESKEGATSKLPAGDLVFRDGEVKQVKFDPSKDKIFQKAEKLLGRDVKNAEFGAWGIGEDLNAASVKKAYDQKFYTDVQDLAGDILEEIKKDPRNQAKYIGLIKKLIAQENRYGVRRDFDREENLNIPKSMSLVGYRDEILSGAKGSDARAKNALKDFYLMAEKGQGFSKAQVNQFENILRDQFYSVNDLGKRMKVLAKNGLHLNAKPRYKTDSFGNIKSEVEYIIDMENSFR
jgi:hypothetical protein